MTNQLHKLQDYSELILDGPWTWPRTARRIFLVTLPISLPMWLFVFVAILTIICVGIPLLMFSGVFRLIKDMWNNE
jgi:hypothetical protein